MISDLFSFMRFYDLTKEKRQQLVEEITQNIFSDLTAGKTELILKYFSDEDTYIRKSAYLAIGRIYKSNAILQSGIIELLDQLFKSDHTHVRQTTINAAGEVGMKDFEPIEHLMKLGLFDAHHSVRNAVIGSMKKMGEKNPKPVLIFARQFLHHEDKEIRREICHGIELRGRTHPQDILPLLKELQFDKTARVRNTLVHVLGQIAYKKGCLETVVADLLSWENQELVAKAVDEIIDVHHRYRNFTLKTQEEAKRYIDRYFKAGN